MSYRVPVGFILNANIRHRVHWFYDLSRYLSSLPSNDIVLS